jgi:hypothetical protein
MKNVELKFNDISVDVFDDGWLCICDGENQIFLRPEYFKKLLEALTTPVVVGQSEQYCDWCSSTEEVEVKICKRCRRGMDDHR